MARFTSLIVHDEHFPLAAAKTDNPTFFLCGGVFRTLGDCRQVQIEPKYAAFAGSTVDANLAAHHFD
jgi:hypothetical protein